MVAIDITYQGNLRCRLRHRPSAAEIGTDAPKDNMGKGEAFSPTDLVAAAMCSCMMTIMAIVAARHGIELAGMQAEVTKEMAQMPVRRIGRVATTFRMPPGIDPALRSSLEQAALACPVKKSLDPDIETPVVFQYPD